MGRKRKEDGPISPTSLRLPTQTRKRLESAAEKSHQSITDWIVGAIEARLAGACGACGRDYSVEQLKERVVELAGLLAKVERR